MSVKTIKINNYRNVHGTREIKPNGNSFLLLADSGEGKTNMLDLILTHMGIGQYPANPLTEGENEGFTEIEWMGDDGTVYTIARKFKKKEDGLVLDRFRVRSSTGATFSQQEFLNSVVYKGIAKRHFDYYKYFFECKSPEARFKYLVDSIGGKEVYDNNKEIENIEKERAVVSGQMNMNRPLWESKLTSVENIERDAAYYAEEKKPDEIKAKKQAALDKRVDVKKLSDDYLSLQSSNEMYRDKQEALMDLKLKICHIEDELKIAKINYDDMYKEVVKLTLKDTEERQLKEKLDNVQDENKKIEEAADHEFDSEMVTLNLFNNNRQSFLEAIKNYRIWESYQEEWDSHTERIKQIRAENKQMFSQKLPIPELSIGEANGKDVVLYDGREFSFDNLSTGETLKITTRIQAAINPKKSNVIVIPCGQNLGSKLFEILDECKKFEVQAAIEYTDWKEPFHMEFVEDYIQKAKK